MRGAAAEFNELRARLRLLLELHRTAATEEARSSLVALLEELFLTLTWNVAVDLLANDWDPDRGLPRPTRSALALVMSEGLGLDQLDPPKDEAAALGAG